jgi:hypothetical protein
VSGPPPHADASKTVTTIPILFTIPVCHPSPEGGWGDTGVPRCRYAQAGRLLGAYTSVGGGT